MATAIDTAAYILSQRATVDAVKLQKLLYYAQAWHVVSMDTTLFEDEIKAFEHGPVTYSVWDLHRGHSTLSRRNFPAGDPSRLTAEERSVIDAVMAAYGRLGQWELSKLTHAEAPWSEAWNSRDRRILVGSLRDYYAKELVKPARERTTPEIPRILDARVTYMESGELEALVETLDEADDLSHLLAEAQRAYSA